MAAMDKGTQGPLEGPWAWNPVLLEQSSYHITKFIIQIHDCYNDFPLIHSLTQQMVLATSL